MLSLILLGEGLVVALLLFDDGYPSLTWKNMGLSSLYIQCIILSALLLVYPLRNPLIRLSALMASIIVILITLTMTGLTTVASQWLQPLHYPMLDFVELLVSGSAAVIFTSIYLRYCYLHSGWRYQIEKTAQAEIKALHAMIRPHFFFNSLNAVAELLHRDATKAEQILLDLSKLFRAVLKQQDCPTLAIGEELELIQRYLDIEKIRFAERLSIVWQIPEPLPDIRIPTLLLQPLIENAIRHGIGPSPDIGELTIQLQHQETCRGRHCWQFKIGNTYHPDLGHTPGNGLALANVQQRLQVHYGNRAYFTAYASSTYYTVVIELPIDSG